VNVALPALSHLSRDITMVISVKVIHNLPLQAPRVLGTGTTIGPLACIQSKDGSIIHGIQFMNLIRSNIKGRSSFSGSGAFDIAKNLATIPYNFQRRITILSRLLRGSKYLQEHSLPCKNKLNPSFHM